MTQNKTKPVHDEASKPTEHQPEAQGSVEDEHELTEDDLENVSGGVWGVSRVTPVKAQVTPVKAQVVPVRGIG